MTEKAKQALEEWRTENSRRCFGGSFYVLKHRAISVHGGMWVVQEWEAGETKGKGKNRVKSGKDKRPHFDPWRTVSPRITKDAAAARLAVLI